MTQRVLVTGASGFIGATVVAHYARQGWEVRAAARDPTAIIAPHRNVDRVAMQNLAAPLNWAPLLAGVDFVIHLAGIAHAHEVVPENMYHRVNAEAVGSLAETARGCIKRIVFISSARAQAGFSAREAITEADPPKPIDAYGQSKLKGEQLLKKSGVCFTVLRPTLVYGRGVKGNVARLARLARSPLPLPFAGFNNLRSLLALENLVSAIDFVLRTERAEGETFLVADAAPVTVADMIGAMRKGLGRPPFLMRGSWALKHLLTSLGMRAEWERIAGSLVVDTGKLRNIGWSPSLKTREGLTRMMSST